MIEAKSSGNTQKELTPAGSHLARCYSMVHIGTIKDTFQGEEKIMNKVRLTWELPGEMRVFNEENGEQPMVISKEYTLSMHEKANLRKDLESWRGKSFTEDQAESFDITVLLGIACMLSVVHTVSKNNGNTYANISNVSGLPKGLKPTPQINPTFEFNYDDKFDTAFVENLPDFLKDKIKSSEEYKNRIAELGGEEQKKVETKDISEDDDLPF